PLSVLNELNNNDKHRACNFTWVHSRNVGLQVHGNDGGIIEVLFKTFYLGQVETVTLPMSAAAVIPSARVITTGTFVLSLREEGIWDDLPVVQVLERCFKHAEKVIGKLTPFFRKE